MITETVEDIDGALKLYFIAEDSCDDDMIGYKVTMNHTTLKL